MVFEYEEASGSPSESGDVESMTATRTLHCDWENRYDVVAGLLGTQYPHHSYTNFIARNWNIDPLEGQRTDQQTPGDNTITAYTKAVVQIGYELVQGEGRDGSDPGGTNPMKMTFFEEALEESIEKLTLSGRKFRWHDYGNKALPMVNETESPQATIVLSDWRLTYYNVTVLPDLDTYMGKVNETPVTSQTLGQSFEAETLLFHPWTLARTVSTTTAAWTMNLSFTYNPNGWNKFPWPDWEKYTAITGNTSMWTFVSRVAGLPSKFFIPTDFTPILPPPPDPVPP